MSHQLTYIILAIIVFLFVGMTVKDWWFSSKRKKKEAAQPSGGNGRLEITLPLCLQAYERLVVFLERSRPEFLIQRLYQPQLNVQETGRLLTRTIRSEYEHNVSQQIYVSDAAWDAIESAKEQLIHLIHAVASSLPPEEDGSMLRKKLLNLSSKEGGAPIALALKILNNESKKLLYGAKNNS